jgi:DNA (cytosine-5)-methyltransferase 1
VNVANTEITTLSLFSGVGGLDLGWHAATGGRVVGYAERDAYAVSVLLKNMEAQALESAPIWGGDLAELPLAPFHGVDAIIGGFPCQDISVAGKQAGIIEGNRSSLWRTGFLRAIRELRPRYVFVENVGALLIRGLDIVLGDLSALGYDAQWTTVRASSVGAPHRRERVFILAMENTARTSRSRGGARRGVRQTGSPVEHPTSRGGEQRHTCGVEQEQSGARDSGENMADAGSPAVRRHSGTASGAQSQDEGRRTHDGDRTECGGADVADTAGRPARPARSAGHAQRQAGCVGAASEAVGNADKPRLQGLERDINHASGRQIETGSAGLSGGTVFPPGPNDADTWSAILEQRPHLAPAVEPGFRVLADGVARVVDASRADQLRCVGNGVVALQAATAARLLLRRMTK